MKNLFSAYFSIIVIILTCFACMSFYFAETEKSFAVSTFSDTLNKMQWAKDEDRAQLLEEVNKRISAVRPGWKYTLEPVDNVQDVKYVLILDYQLHEMISGSKKASTIDGLIFDDFNTTEEPNSSCLTGACNVLLTMTETSNGSTGYSKDEEVDIQIDIKGVGCNQVDNLYLELEETGDAWDMARVDETISEVRTAIYTVQAEDIERGYIEIHLYSEGYCGDEYMKSRINLVIPTTPHDPESVAGPLTPDSNACDANACDVEITLTEQGSINSYTDGDSIYLTLNLRGASCATLDYIHYELQNTGDTWETNSIAENDVRTYEHSYIVTPEDVENGYVTFVLDTEGYCNSNYISKQLILEVPINNHSAVSQTIDLKP